MKFGNKEDSEVINYAICSGVKGIFTAHGNSIQDLKLNPEINKLINLGIFERIIFLDGQKKGMIKKVI
ncbi:MAG: hypothetical protein IJ890_09260 [Clostridia bacterium]|nr:hypothetical protein [Clostridia bacterium]